MVRPKNVLTTGEVARLCHVAPRTVSKWFDSGRLRGYRIPGSKDRRIPVDQLLRFLRTHNMPLNGLETGRERVLLIDADEGLTETLRSTLMHDGFEVATASSALEAGAAAKELQPQTVVVDTTIEELRPAAVVRFFRAAQDDLAPRLIGTASGLTEAQGQALLQAGFDAYLPKPFTARTLIRLLQPQSASVAPMN